MPEGWSNKFDKCQNCGTIRFSHKSKGYCLRCYPLVLRLEKIELWDFNNPKTLKGYPKEPIIYNERDFGIIKPGIMRQIKGRLSDLKYYEQGRNIEVDGCHMVLIFQHIARVAGSKNKEFLWHREDLFDHNFNQEQMRILYRILLEIEESIPWKGIDWNDIYFRK